VGPASSGEMNSKEQETIGLCIAAEAIDDIVNHTLLRVREVQQYPGEAEVYFETSIHQQMFLVRLLDFTKKARTRSVTGVTGSCLDVLLTACETKHFDVDGSVAQLERAATKLRDWLAESSHVRLWIPTFEVNADVSVPRTELLFILGNHVKHNLARLTYVSKAVQKLLHDHHYTVKLEQVPLALDDLREHLQHGYFSYYTTWLAELLNNVRWGLHAYLTPTFRSSYRKVPGDPIKYAYAFPPEVVDPIAREWFWRLMNNVRREPYVWRFTGAHYMKNTSTIERFRPDSNEAT